MNLEWRCKVEGRIGDKVKGNRKTNKGKIKRKSPAKQGYNIDQWRRNRDSNPGTGCPI